MPANSRWDLIRDLKVLIKVKHKKHINIFYVYVAVSLFNL